MTRRERQIDALVGAGFMTYTCGPFVLFLFGADPKIGWAFQDLEKAIIIYYLVLMTLTLNVLVYFWGADEYRSFVRRFKDKLKNHTKKARVYSSTN